MEDKEFKLGPEDSAVVFRADGTMEIRVPHQEDTDMAFPSSMAAFRCATLMSHEDLIDAVDARMDGDIAKGKQRLN